MTKTSVSVQLATLVAEHEKHLGLTKRSPLFLPEDLASEIGASTRSSHAATTSLTRAVHRTRQYFRLPVRSGFRLTPLAWVSVIALTLCMAAAVVSVVWISSSPGPLTLITVVFAFAIPLISRQILLDNVDTLEQRIGEIDRITDQLKWHTDLTKYDYETRQRQHVREKRQLAISTQSSIRTFIEQARAKRIQLIFGTGTTTASIANVIFSPDSNPFESKIEAYSNNLPALGHLKRFIRPGFLTHVGDQLPGVHSPSFNAMVGDDTLAYYTGLTSAGGEEIQRCAFLSCAWILVADDGRRLTVVSRDEWHSKFARLLINQCDRVFLVTHLSKFTVLSSIDALSNIMQDTASSYSGYEIPMDLCDKVEVITTLRPPDYLGPLTRVSQSLRRSGHSSGPKNYTLSEYCKTFTAASVEEDIACVHALHNLDAAYGYSAEKELEGQLSTPSSVPATI